MKPTFKDPLDRPPSVREAEGADVLAVADEAIAKTEMVDEAAEAELMGPPEAKTQPEPPTAPPPPPPQEPPPTKADEAVEKAAILSPQSDPDPEQGVPVDEAKMGNIVPEPTKDKDHATVNIDGEDVVRTRREFDDGSAIVVEKGEDEEVVVSPALPVEQLEEYRDIGGFTPEVATPQEAEAIMTEVTKEGQAAREAEDEADEGRPEQATAGSVETADVGAVEEDTPARVGREEGAVGERAQGDVGVGEQEISGGREQEPATGREGGVQGAAERERAQEKPDGEVGRLYPERTPARDLDGSGTQGGVPERPIIDPVPAAIPVKPTDRVNANIQAIELVRKLREEGRYANKEEAKTLIRYTGWGGLASNIESRIKLLRQVATDDEISAFRQSSLDAHYTPPDLIRDMWEMAVDAGFTGGSVIEPGAGIGRFAFYMPDSLKGAVVMNMIEREPLSGSIAELIHGERHKVQIMDLRDVHNVNESAQLAIGNVPFGSTKIRHRGMSFSLNNYAIMRSLEALQPGGLAILITSPFTLNSKGTTQRGKMHEIADLEYALWLPEQTHADTNARVSPHLLVFRRRIEGEQAADNTWATDRVEWSQYNKIFDSDKGDIAGNLKKCKT